LSESASARAFAEVLLDLLPIRRGHFQYESGHHGDTWLDLDALFTRPAALRPITNELARRFAPGGIQAVCGPLVGGALVAKMIAEELGIEFYFIERITAENANGARYALSVSQRPLVRGKSIAVIDDAINAGSAVGATLAELRAAGAHPVVIGALIVLGDGAESIAAAQEMPFEYITQLPTPLWQPTDCPLCRAAVPLSHGASA
jgi:orotate phosphoribosyltransferase